MSRVNANGYFDAQNSKEDRLAKKQALNARRTQDYLAGAYARDGGVAAQRPGDAPQFLQDYWDYYKTDRGYHPRSGNSNGGWNETVPLPFMNMPLLTYINEIDTPVLMLHGSKAHSLYFSKDAFARLTGDNKELKIIEGANHTDLYDNMDFIPFDEIAAFFTRSLAAADK